MRVYGAFIPSLKEFNIQPKLITALDAHVSSIGNLSSNNTNVYNFEFKILRKGKYPKTGKGFVIHRSSQREFLVQYLSN